jgi:hypothetical protein
MKYKSITKGILLLCFLGIASSALYLLGYSVDMILLLLVISIFFGLVISIANGFYIPSKWFFNNRFWLFGAISGIIIFTINKILDIDKSMVFDVNMLLASFLISIITGILIVGTFSYQRFRKLKKKTQYTKRALEIEILSDSAVLMNDDDYPKRGRLILTNKRLCFVTENDQQTVTYFEFTKIETDIQLIKRLHVPYKILMQNLKTEIRVAFPSLWKQKIEKTAYKINTELDVF